MNKKKDIYQELYEIINKETALNISNPKVLEAEVNSIMFAKPDSENDFRDLSSAFIDEYFSQPYNRVVHYESTRIYKELVDLRNEVKELKNKVDQLSK